MIGFTRQGSGCGRCREQTLADAGRDAGCSESKATVGNVLVGVDGETEEVSISAPSSVPQEVTAIKE